VLRRFATRCDCDFHLPSHATQEIHKRTKTESLNPTSQQVIDSGLAYAQDLRGRSLSQSLRADGTIEFDHQLSAQKQAVRFRLTESKITEYVA